MLTARIIFSEDGTVLEHSYPNIVVGDNDTTLIQISFKDKENQFINLNGLTLDCVIKRPDGSISPSITLTHDIDPTIGKLLIGNWITEIEGNVLFTFRLRNPNIRALGGTEAPLKATGLATIVVGDGSQPSDTVITEPQYQALQDAITENANNISNNRTDIDALENGKLDKVGGQEVVYTNDENGNPSFLKYSVAPIKDQKTVAVRGEDGRLEIETPVDKQHAANKDYVDEAVLINKMPFTEVSKINYKTGFITYKINPKVVDYIDQTKLQTDGIIRVYFKIPEGCKYEDKGGNK